jgi:nitrous oxidase accessory protein
MQLQQIHAWGIGVLEDWSTGVFKCSKQQSFTPLLHYSISPTILLIGLLLFIFPSVSYAKTLTVGADYSTIGDALKGAHDGDIIEVLSGKYKEKLKIDKSIHLRGIDNPVIFAAKGNVVLITKPDVIFEGFTLTYESTELSSDDTAIYISKGADRVTVRNNHLLNVMFGIWNVEGKGIRIEDNIIVGIKDLEKHNRGNCINLTSSQKVHIAHNTLSYCRDGIYMELSHDASVIGNMIKESRYSVHTMWVDRCIFNNNTTHDSLVGLAIMYTDYPEIKDNLSYGNQTHGILFIQSVRGKIKGNTVIGNTKGIYLNNSIYNEISSNLVMNNQLGIHNWGGSEDNTVNGNSFINNEVQVKYVASIDQEWNENYWSDYVGWDMNNDGKGDNSYESSSVVDYLFWKFPVAKVLYASPSLHILWMLEKQFPIFDIPKIIDNRPSILPLHANWRELKEKFASYTPERFYGDIRKLPDFSGDDF